jgi:hypothetical protein
VTGVQTCALPICAYTRHHPLIPADAGIQSLTKIEADRIATCEPVKELPPPFLP